MTLCSPFRLNQRWEGHRSRVIVPWPGPSEATSAFSLVSVELCRVTSEPCSRLLFQFLDLISRFLSHSSCVHSPPARVLLSRVPRRPDLLHVNHSGLLTPASHPSMLPPLPLSSLPIELSHIHKWAGRVPSFPGGPQASSPYFSATTQFLLGKWCLCLLPCLQRMACFSVRSNTDPA